MSVARADTGTMTSEFFICIGDQPELDFGGKRNPDIQGFAAFGRLFEGYEIMRRIQYLPYDNQMLIQPVIIDSIKELNKTEMIMQIFLTIPTQKLQKNAIFSLHKKNDIHIL